MTDLMVGFGLVLVIEGLLWAVFPNYALKMLETAAETPTEVLRLVAVIAMAIGVGIVWFARA